VKADLEKIALREGKSLAELYREITMPGVEVYIKNHKSGNSQFTLDKPWEAGMVALPTIGEPLDRSALADMDEETLVEIVKKGRARVDEAASDLRRRGWERTELNDLKEGRVR